MRPAVLLPFLLLSSAFPAQPADDVAGRLSWLGPDGTVWSAPLEPIDGAPEVPPPALPLVSRGWHPTRLDVEVPLLEGGAFSLAGARGRVLVLEFWASWCAPCWETLPALQALYEMQGERGLEAVAVNARENPDVALNVAAELELTLPIGEYTDEIHQLFQVETLPTVIVADREGRVRGRWDRHEAGTVDDVTTMVGQLIGEAEDGDTDPSIARVFAGEGLLRVDWARRVPARPRGLIVAPGEEGANGILAALAGSIVLYGRDGRVLRDWSVPAGTGLLRRGEPDADGAFPLVGFRPGGRRLILLSMPEGGTESRQAPAPVFDANLLELRGSSWEIVAGTSESLVHIAEGEPRRLLEDSGLVSSLAWTGRETEGRLVALSVGAPGPSQLIWLDRSLKEVGRQEAPPDAWSLIVDPGRPRQAGVAPAAVTATAVGRFLGGASSQAAVATRSGWLFLVELETGSERFRARWDDGFVSHLAAGDLDGDGLDELVAAAGQDLILLSLERPGPQ